MTDRRKFLVFTPPFSGHANVLRSLARRFPEATFEFVVTGWANLRFDLGLPATHLAAGPLTQTDPALWTLPRVAALLPTCLRFVEERKPDVILYDFFSPEGRLAGKLLNIPAWGSIPALLGPFEDPSYLAAKLATPENRAALGRIREITGLALAPADFEQVSDGLHLPGDLDLVWSYPTITPATYARGRKPAPRVFVGNPSAEAARPQRPARPLVLFSLGTVVLDNLWNQREDVRPKLRALLAGLAERWRDAPFDVHWVTQGKHILDTYPSNWTVSDRIDQEAVLDRASVFVTHGGSNSFHEAVVRRVPMVAVPFFGDQPAIAARIEGLGLGFNVALATGVDTKDAASVVDASLCDRIDQAVRSLLADPAPVASAYAELKLPATDLGPLLAGCIPLAEGDLLYGTNVARRAYVEATRGHGAFRMFEFVPFSTIAPRADALPRIVDIYHDAIRDERACEQEIACAMEPYAGLIKDYREFLAGERDICQMCLRGLDFFTRHFRVHFLLDAYDPVVNWITTEEIRYVLANRERFEDRVSFYGKVAGTYVPVGFDFVAISLARASSAA